MVGLIEIPTTPREQNRAAQRRTDQRAAGFRSDGRRWSVAQRYTRSPYGTITTLDADFTPTAAGTVPLVNNLYQGMALDAVTGLYYERARDYSPALGRWMEQDPAQYISGANTYQFVGSDPADFTDPTGMVRGRVPNQGEPNSFYEKVGPDGKVTTRAFYNEKGQMYNRQDYVPGKIHDDVPTPHEHVRSFNERGYPTGEKCNALDPETVDRTPGSGVKALPKAGGESEPGSVVGDAEKAAEGVGDDILDAGESLGSDIIWPFQVFLTEAEIMNSPGPVVSGARED